MRKLLLTLVLLFNISLIAQVDLSVPKLKLPNTKRVDRDPAKLVANLTEGKESDKEKFDAIFTWVAENIHYDYGTYYSPRGATMPQLKKILKHKSGICMDYAYLMDTLCTLANIRNVSVYGYAKDELFDVADSLYIDNHAWNAVKLENYWYVYDVTWAAGQMVADFKWFSKVVLNWEKSLYSKKKIKTVTFFSKFQTECENKMGKFSQTYSTLPWRNYILLKILSHHRLRMHFVMDKKVNPDYYLTNPEMFAITHIPDNPYWSLTGEYSTMRKFETDSAYYHFTDSTLVGQDRQSRHCGGCDSWFTLDDKAKNKQMKHNAWAYNPKNHFVPWMTNYALGNIFYADAIPMTDSASKIQQLDSALTYLNIARDDLRECARDVSKENQLLRAKNSEKLKTLQAENRVYISFMHGVLAETNRSTSQMKKFIGKTRSTEVGLRADKKKIHALGGETKPFKNKAHVKAIEDKYILLAAQIDSLNAWINLNRGSYDTMLVKLSNNLWQKSKLRDSLAGPFFRGMMYRRMYLVDSRKKIINEDRKMIEPIKKLYVQDLETTIYRLSDTCGTLGMQIFSNMRYRDALVKEAGYLLNVLENEKTVAKDSLKHYVKFYHELIQENICWIVSGSSKLKSVTVGYKAMIKNQKYLELLIQKENRAEASRYRLINKEITRRKIKYRSVPSHNVKVCSQTKRKVAYYKRDFLKRLKDKRKEEKKQAMKKRV